MSTSVYKLEKDLCRCCHAEGSFYNLAEPVYNLGQKEVYSEMLRTCLCIEVSQMPGELSSMTYTICDTCVLRLRDAHNFKQQVELCELRFREMYKNIVIETVIDVGVKDELPVTFDKDVKEEVEVDDDNDDDFVLRFDDSDDEQPIIQVRVEESGKPKARPKPNKSRTKTKKTPPKKSKLPSDTEQTLKEEDKSDDVMDKRKKGPRTLQKWVIQESDYRTEGDNYVCARCDKTYFKRISLVFHVKSKHYRIPRFVCQYCNKSFFTPAPLTKHKLEEHNIDERFKCKACNASFNTKVQLRKHINNFHMLGEKYKCESCEYESFSFEGMYKHKFKHRTEKNYHCRFCRKSFLRKATLDLHERIHTGDRRKVCKVCGQAFVQKASLNYHMTKYHPEVNF